MPTDHAILAPSAASRWLACTPSARLEEQMPQQDTAYTREGTLAHAVAEEMLKLYLKLDADTVYDSDEFLELMQEEQNRTPFRYIHEDCAQEGLDFLDMAETVYEGYVRIVMEKYLTAKAEDPEAVLLIEQKLKLSEYVPAGFGSSDSIIIWNDTCDVNDLKYGKGLRVDAEDNKQMMLYALGALCGPCELYNIRTVRMSILQPRLNHASTAEMQASGLLDWAKNVLRPAALQAFEGEGRLVTGPHCQFCRAAPRCRALLEKAQAETAKTSAPEMLDISELGDALQAADVLKNWAKKLEEHCLMLALEGTAIPGYKIVEGRSLRTIKDQPAAIGRLLDAGFSAEDVCRPQELKTITDLEKLLRKGAFNDLLGDLVIKPQGKPTLVPQSDKRPEFNTAGEDFKNINI